MKKTICAAACLTALWLTGAGPAAATRTLCVAAGTPGCFATIQAAVDAAANGDTIQVAAGTYAGGITIAKSVDLRGAGSGATLIKGGGPVVTIGDLAAATTSSTVSIEGVTITGGVNPRRRGAIAQGGGVWIPGNPSHGRPGAIVTISDSVITQNRVRPRASAAATSAERTVRLLLVRVRRRHRQRRDADADNVKVTGNVAGAVPGDASAATDASGGGIMQPTPAPRWRSATAS